MALPSDDPVDQQFSMVYEELRRLARRVKQHDGSATLNPTALVHEAYLQLKTSESFTPLSQNHLKYTVVRAMRRLLIDAARHRATVKAGAGAAHFALEDVAPPAVDPARLIEIHLALDRLEQSHQLRAQVFECHFFGGLAQTEIAAITGLGEKIVSSHLRIAKAWLTRELAA